MWPKVLFLKKHTSTLVLSLGASLSFFTGGLERAALVDQNVWASVKNHLCKVFTLAVHVMEPPVEIYNLHWWFSLLNYQCNCHLQWRLIYINRHCKILLTLAVSLCDPPMIMFYSGGFYVSRL
jgi:hypothetical protein